MIWKYKSEKFGYPIMGNKYTCTLKHYETGKLETHDLIAIDEDDVMWRTVDDLSEINEYAWEVIYWESKESEK